VQVPTAGKPFQYPTMHLAANLSHMIPSAGKCASEKVKPLQRITSPLAHHKMVKKNSKKINCEKEK